MVLPGFAWGDGFSGDRLLRVDGRIAASPEDPGAYWQRADLRRETGDFSGALEDLGRAAELAPGSPSTAILRARVYLDSGQALAALEVLEPVARREGSLAEVQRLRAESLLRLDRPGAAAEAFSMAIEARPGAGPALYLARARAQVEAGVGAWPEALAGLDAGIAQMGPVPGLVREAIEIEISMGQIDHALERISRASAESGRRETWLEWRGQILENAGRSGEALEAYQDAMGELLETPSSTRSSPAMQALEYRLGQSLEKLSLASQGKGD
jgi:predicted Zn-dependent protease